MKLKIDDREKKLIKLVQAFKAMYGFKFEILDIYKNTITKIRISSLN